MAIKETFLFILLVMIPVAMMAKYPFMLRGNAKAFTLEEEDTNEPADEACDPDELQKQINQTKTKLDDIQKAQEETKTKLDDLYKAVESCPECEDGWAKHGLSCYQIVKNSKAIDWDTARGMCKNQRGDLAVIKSSEENEFIFSTLEANKSEIVGAWIGLFEEHNNRFFWVDDTTLSEDGFKNWAENRPEKGDMNYNKVYMQTSDGKWYDAPTLEKRKLAVCEKLVDIK